MIDFQGTSEEINTNPSTEYPILQYRELKQFLHTVATVRPVYIWGSPGIGKSSAVEKFAEELDLECVSLLGSQLAPEDILGLPQIVDGRVQFCTPRTIARENPYVLFLDEFNSCSQAVQKSFYSLILDFRVGEYEMPKGSIIIAAGNRKQDGAIVNPVSSALVNRVVHVHLEVSVDYWLAWAIKNDLHAIVTEYVQEHPDHLSQSATHDETPFSTPRSWHMLSDALKNIEGPLDESIVTTIACGCLGYQHAQSFISFALRIPSRYDFSKVISGSAPWPKPDEKILLSYFAYRFRDYLLQSTSAYNEEDAEHEVEAWFEVLSSLSTIDTDMTKVVLTPNNDNQTLPNWFLNRLSLQHPQIIEISSLSAES